ncbi:MAG: toxic anion resistance protein [Niameybacter sp.]|uniref:toxic anion resistance protein n=1 Tax=Niameybacter sp. TaxID=2033640 RepID=UPI002FCA1052
MAIQFNPSNTIPTSTPIPVDLEASVLGGITLEPQTTSHLQPVKQEEVVTFTQTYKEKLRSLPEVEALTGEIRVDDPSSVLLFGQNATVGISKVSDSLLSTMKAVKAEEAGEMITQLTKIMDRFDIQELAEVKEPTFLGKLFSRAKNSVEALFEKYESMGSEVDQVYMVLKKYEFDIEKSNVTLKTMYDVNIQYYQDLEKYIVAGELGIEEITTGLIPQFEQKAIESGSQLDLANVESLRRIGEMLEQRVYDLRVAESIALQTIPMIQGIQYSNFNLTRKINSAFIITLPIFKQCLTQAVMLRRQDLQAKSLKALDDKTNELLIRNAQNMANQSTSIAKMATGSSVHIETLQKTWETIMNGIEQTRAIEEENRLTRQSNTKTLESLKYEMAKKLNIK